jgi:hypothetical protein
VNVGVCRSAGAAPPPPTVDVPPAVALVPPLIAELPPTLLLAPAPADELSGDVEQASESSSTGQTGSKRTLMTPLLGK